jgi:crotonobetainyl-CoA:carnitine CoA-transferase CaiB-like acyl-CoA transferase
VNRSKRSIAVRWTEKAGRAIILDLVKGADAVIEQFRPGYLDRMGLGYSELCRVKPDIIFVSLTGYGQSGPYSSQDGRDVNFLGYTGLIDLTRNMGEPVIPGGQVADVAGSYMTVIACLAALWDRQTTGKGRKVDVSVLDSALPFITQPFAAFFAGGPQPGNLPCYGLFECSDRKYVALGALEAKHWKRFCEVIESPEFIPLQFAVGKEGEAVRKELQAVFRTRTRDEWMAKTAGEDICLSPVLELPELENDPHIRERGMIVDQSHPVYGKSKVIGPPPTFSAAAPTVSRGAPVSGEDTVSILQELGYGEDEIQQLLKTGIAVAGS